MTTSDDANINVTLKGKGIITGCLCRPDSVGLVHVKGARYEDQ
jgi:hypothetical protein